jgi:hypothetical protein
MMGTPAPSGEKPGDCHKAVCDGHGQITQMVDDTDSDDKEQCTNDACSNGVPTHQPVEAGTCNENGGKVCGANNGPWAGQCVECLTNGDCTSPNVCLGSVCGPANCADNVKNGGESDVDCGGPCPPCADGKTCNGGSDCLSTACVLTGFDFTCAVASCSDGFVDGTELGETDVDCGGPNCMPCGTGLKCLADGDCLGGVCKSNLCAPTCTDGQKNQGESDVDCGGPCAKKCAYQKQCYADSDCVTGWCNPNLGSCDAQILAQNQAFPGAVAVDGTSVYWVQGGVGVMKLPLGTSTPIAVSSGEGPYEIALDASWPSTAQYVYWTSDAGGGAVKRRRVDLSQPVETLVTNEYIAAGVATSGSAVFWSNVNLGTVKKLPIGGTASTLAMLTQSFDMHLAIDATYLYFTHPKSMSVYRVPLAGGMVQGMATAAKPVGIAVDGLNLYWSDYALGEVWKTQLIGGNPARLAMGLSSPATIAIDTNNVYTYEDVPGVARVLEISSVTGATKVLVSGLTQPGGIAVDDKWVYFSHYGDHSIRRVLKQ